MTQKRRDTDTDHTGAESEAVITLARELPAGGTTELTAIYSGTVARSSLRMERSGISAMDAARMDWDEIGAEETSIRGFGNVLWYPVASPPVFLGDGAKMAEAVGEQRRRQRKATARLRLQMDYIDRPPQAAFFCGRMARFVTTAERSEGEQVPGIATAEFPPAVLGFGSPSLFTVQEAPELEGRIVGTITSDVGGAGAVEREAKAAQAVVTEWLGGLRERQPLLLDHAGQPFAQESLLVESIAEAANPFAMVHLLSHAWFASDEVWLDEGVAQFLPIVALERTQGLGAAMAVLEDQRAALRLAESNGGDEAAAAQSLAAATREVMFRNKAVAVLWMLRGLAGDEAMKKALTSLRTEPVSHRGAAAFEAALETASGKNLRWFFEDWVTADKGLPDLRIVSAAARVTPERQGVSEGSLVAVEVRNEGAATAEVPITVRSGQLTATERLRVPGHGVASVRILFQGRPEQVEVNDGSVPEAGAEDHHVKSLQP